MLSSVFMDNLTFKGLFNTQRYKDSLLLSESKEGRGRSEDSEEDLDVRIVVESRFHKTQDHTPTLRFNTESALRILDIADQAPVVSSVEQLDSLQDQAAVALTALGQQHSADSVDWSGKSDLNRGSLLERGARLRPVRQRDLTTSEISAHQAVLSRYTQILSQEIKVNTEELIEDSTRVDLSAIEEEEDFSMSDQQEEHLESEESSNIHPSARGATSSRPSIQNLTMPTIAVGRSEVEDNQQVTPKRGTPTSHEGESETGTSGVATTTTSPSGASETHSKGEEQVNISVPSLHDDLDSEETVSASESSERLLMAKHASIQGVLDNYVKGVESSAMSSPALVRTSDLNETRSQNIRFQVPTMSVQSPPRRVVPAVTTTVVQTTTTPIAPQSTVVGGLPPPPIAPPTPSTDIMKLLKLVGESVIKIERNTDHMARCYHDMTGRIANLESTQTLVIQHLAELEVKVNMAVTTSNGLTANMTIVSSEISQVSSQLANVLEDLKAQTSTIQGLSATIRSGHAQQPSVSGIPPSPLITPLSAHTHKIMGFPESPTAPTTDIDPENLDSREQSYYGDILTKLTSVLKETPTAGIVPSEVAWVYTKYNRRIAAGFSARYPGLTGHEEVCARLDKNINLQDLQALGRCLLSQSGKNKNKGIPGAPNLQPYIPSAPQPRESILDRPTQQTASPLTPSSASHVDLLQMLKEL